MDSIGWYIATIHQLVGHDKTAIFLEQPLGDKRKCLLCIYDANPTEANWRMVEKALSR